MSVRTTSRPEAATDNFALLRRTKRVWAIGAIHGDARRLAALHDALFPRLGPGDRLVYLGNYLGHGPDVVGTVDELVRFRRDVIAQPWMFASDVVFLRGSQEEMWQKLQQLQFAINPREVLEWTLDRGVGATLSAYGADAKKGLVAARDGVMSITRWTTGLRSAVTNRPGHQAFMSALKRAAFTDDGGLLFVHAGLNAALPLSSQGDRLWWGATGFGEWPAPYGGYRLVVRGYDPAHGGVRQSRFGLTIDAGSGFGGSLLAACISPSGEILDQIEI
jgi:serine/threonine protein phosphatase 1